MDKLEREFAFIDACSAGKLNAVLAFLPVSKSLASEGLECAVAAERWKLVEPLVRAGADVNRGVLTAACANENVRLFDWALAHGAHPDKPRDDPPMRWALIAFRRANYFVQKLVDAGASVNKRDVRDGTVLLEAASVSDASVVKILVDAGARVNPGLRMQTPLHAAASRKRANVDVVRILVDAGAKKNARDADGRTPLDVVPRGAAFEKVRALLANAPRTKR